MLIPCQCCGKQLPKDYRSWFVCNQCGYRVCPSCLPRHRGPYGSGGYKCSQCAHGQMKN